MEILYWLQDVREHLRVSRRRKSLRQPGRGFDYTADEYRDVVHRVVSRLHPRRMRLRVAEIIQQTPTTKTFHMERIGEPLPPFRPGQYVNVFVDVDGVQTSRPYSIASPPGRDTLELTIRDKPDGFVEVQPEEVQAFLDPLPVSRVWGWARPPARNWIVWASRS